jgi:MarR family transcriptional regulator, 2-MHQ and catechol-resistance regulon repressor
MPNKSTLKDQKELSWILLHQVLDSITKYEEDTFTKVNITPQQFAVLEAINYIREPVTPTDVANWLDRNTNSITLIIDRMEKDGLVSRTRDLKDRRALRLTVSPKGQAIFEKALKVSKGISADIMTCLSQKELDTLIDLANKVSEKVFARRKVKDKIINARTLLRKSGDLKT